MIIERYSFKKLKRILRDEIEALIEEVDSSEDERLGAISFRVYMFDKLKNHDEKTKEVFKDKAWVFKRTVGTVDGEEIFTPVYDPYYESLLEQVMDDFNIERKDLVKKLFELTESREDFHPSDIFAEEYFEEEEVEAAKKEYKVLFKQFAEENGLSRLIAASKIPAFSNIFDKIEWLKGQLDEGI